MVNIDGNGSLVGRTENNYCPIITLLKNYKYLAFFQKIISPVEVLAKLLQNHGSTPSSQCQGHHLPSG
jgi:hypothetical protein